MPRPILPKKYDDQIFKKEVDRQLRNSNLTQLVTSVPYSGAPYGGNGPPDANWYVPVITGTFASAQIGQPWVFNLDIISKLGFRTLIPAKCDLATTGEMRLAIYTAGGTALTGVISLSAGVSVNVQFKWLHGLEPYVWEETWVFIEARRTAGTGNVNIGYPLGGGLQCGPAGCTPSGL